MTLTYNIAGIALIAVLVVFAMYLHQAQGSTIAGQEYLSTYLTTTDANSTSTLKLSPGSIGSVVVSEDGTAGKIDFYDMASTTAATSSEDLIFSFDGAAAEGTYQYDIILKDGLMIDTATGFDGEVTVTYR